MSRLTDEREDEIFAAALEMVAARGFSATTLDAIAERARCSKATLYRQWGGKINLVVEALLTNKPSCSAPLPDTGTLVGDLHALVSLRIDRLINGGTLIMAIAHATLQDAELHDALVTRLRSLNERGEFEQLIDRAVARGEVAPDQPVLTYLPIVMLAPLVLSPLLEGRKLDAGVINDYLDTTLVPLLGLTTD